MPRWWIECRDQQTRREFLRLGGLTLAGLSLPELLRAASAASQRKPKAKACILFFLEGGPSHIDLWDMKPDAPAEIRGEFQPIPTTVPGLQICEHLPLLARQMHHFAVVRSVHHTIVDHNAGTYYMLTGRSPVQGGQLILGDDRSNFPPIGAVLAHFRPSRSMPEFVHIPEVMSNNGRDLPGQRAGWLGARYDPLVTGDPSVPNYTVPGLELPEELAPDGLKQRLRLLSRIDRALGPLREDPAIARLDEYYRRACDLLTSPAVRDAFDLSKEPLHVRERYGLPDRTDRRKGARQFGGLPHLGQSMLLARRLIEAGVRLVTVCTGRRYDQSWDTHRDHFPLLTRSLLPYVDRAFSALIEDLDTRGLLKETLVVAMGEFGRTPRLGQVTSNAGATANGRDHWPHCYTVLFAGAGIQGGAVYGKSDKYGAYPEENPVTPEDIVATVYSALGIDPEARIYDTLNRPHHIALGTPIRDILA